MAALRSDERTGALFAVLSAVLFGMMPFLTKVTYAYGSNPFMTAFMRFFFSTVGAGALVLVLPGLSFAVTRRQMKQIALLSAAYTVTPMLLFLSYEYVDSGLATTLHFTYPVIVMVLNLVIFRARLNPRQALCMALCAGGILCLYTPGGNVNGTGAAIALASGLTYASYIVHLGKSGLATLHVLTMTFWISLLATAESGIFTAAIHRLAFSLPWQGWAAMAALGLGLTLAASALFQLGVFLCGEIKTSLLSTFEPVTSVIVGVIVFREAMTLRTGAGIILILCAAVILVLGDAKRKQAIRESFREKKE